MEIKLNRKLLELALERLRSSDWESFEELSSAYLASDFGELRTMASPSGDGGRDSELFSPSGVVPIVVQYSVSTDWKTKIRKTIARIVSTKPDTRILIYMTNQTVGAKADDLRSGAIASGLFLDVRDKNWFLERFQADEVKYKASCELVDRHAMPYLEGMEVIAKKRPALSNQEAKAALVYLGMQWEDEHTDKGLTKLAFESLIRAALRRTNSDNRLKREEIQNKISSYLPSADLQKIKIYIDSALKRLEKNCIRHWIKQDEFCLTNDESDRLKLKLATQECEEDQFDQVVRGYVDLTLGEPHHSDLDKEDITNRAKRIVDDFLLKSGELFATSVLTGTVSKIDNEILKKSVFSDINKYPPNSSLVVDLPSILTEIILSLRHSSNEVVRKRLRALSDSYTLFAFLRETPDVQTATKKIFSHGNIWLDTTVILPLVAETLRQDVIDKQFTNIVSALHQSGVELFVTDGVIQEVLNHVRISEACSKSRISEWKGRIPYIFYHYVEIGYDPAQFISWAEILRGKERPEDDISEYLQEKFGIRVRPLHDEAATVNVTLKHCVERLWVEAHKTRRNSLGAEQDNSITSILVKHDVESYLGIVALRSKESVSELGYKHWWLTIDSVAWKIRDAVKAEFVEKTPPSPLISLDFLANNLAFGPIRSHIDRATEQMLPVMLDIDLSEGIPREIIVIAEKIRQENIGLPDYLIRRKVRDACDKIKRTQGSITIQSINDEQDAPGNTPKYISELRH